MLKKVRIGRPDSFVRSSIYWIFRVVGAMTMTIGSVD